MHNALMNRRALTTPRRQHGFSITEVMIAAAIGGTLMVGAVSMIIAHTRTAVRSEALIRLQDSWSRVQFFLNQEIQESQGTPVISGCDLQLSMPTSSGGFDTVTYSLNGTDLERTGPTVAMAGTLEEGTSSTDVVMSGVNAFCAELINDSGAVRYTMTLADRSGVTYSNQSDPTGARPSGRVIN